MHVFLSVPLTYLRNLMAEIHQSFVHVAVASGHGLVVFWWHCSTLRTSHFVDDVIFCILEPVVACYKCMLYNCLEWYK